MSGPVSQKPEPRQRWRNRRTGRVGVVLGVHEHAVLFRYLKPAPAERGGPRQMRPRVNTTPIGMASFLTGWEPLEQPATDSPRKE